jgi:hypothetical protein
MRSKEEIEEQVAQVVDQKDSGNGSKFPGMDYEDGVEAALMWVMEEREETPMED